MSDIGTMLHDTAHNISTTVYACDIIERYIKDGKIDKIQGILNTIKNEMKTLKQHQDIYYNKVKSTSILITKS